MYINNKHMAQGNKKRHQLPNSQKPDSVQPVLWNRSCFKKSNKESSLICFQTIILGGPLTNNSGSYKQIKKHSASIWTRRRFSIRIQNTDRMCRAEEVGRKKSSAAFKAVLALSFTLHFIACTFRRRKSWRSRSWIPNPDPWSRA